MQFHKNVIKQGIQYDSQPATFHVMRQSQGVEAE